MKEYIILVIALLLVPICFGDMEINSTIVTDGNINSTIIQVAEGSIDTDFYCYGNNCTTNIRGGQLIVGENQTFTLNDYTSYSTTEKNTRGLSLRKLISDISNVMGPYAESVLSGVKPTRTTSSWDFWATLDNIFVNHAEFIPTRNDVGYISEEIDRLKAENKMLRNGLGITLDPVVLECQTGINKAKRTNQKVITENGWRIDIEKNGRRMFES